MTDGDVNSAARLLVIGGGYTGLRLARAAAQQGTEVWLTHRSEQAPAVTHPLEEQLHWLRFDADQGCIPQLPAGLTQAVVTLPPASDGSDAALQHLLEALRQQPLQWLGYLSTTGVYGDVQGAWVDERSPTQPNLARSQARLRCEQQWLGSGLPVQSFRLPAIYGPGRCPFTQLRNGTARLVHKPAQVFCRIHVDDIVGALLHNLALPLAEQPAVINVSDHAPCPSSETLGYAAHLLGCKLPELQHFAAIAPQMSPMALSFWADNRRVSNRLLCDQLGYRLRYPSYREGFAASLREEQEQATRRP
jgi:nucleoside-diphosphate-sugar epimerase